MPQLRGFKRSLSCQAIWRYAWQARSQQRVLAQEVQGPNPQSQTQQGTSASTFDAQGRLAGRYNANGQPEQLTAPDSKQSQRHYSWDALGRLTQVSQAGQPVSTYAYDHRGLRTTKTTAQSTGQSTAQTTHTLYNESRQPLAELDAQGRITRQYLWLADMLLAVMDGQAKPAAAQAPDSNNTLNQNIPLTQDLWALLQSWAEAVSGHWHLAFIHSNHLGAPELVTDLQGQIIWQASYAPFGAAKVSTSDNNFTLHIRLPGQMFDPETGLHYNRQRYYDPQTGQYLTPDPLGQPDGPNAYLYVAGNPLAFVDPDGLVLFAFDGTGNSEDTSDRAMAGNGISNVVKFRNIYNDSGIQKRYVSGVGTVHKDTKENGGNIVPDDFANNTLLDWLTWDTPLFYNDMGGNYSGPARIDRMMRYFEQEARAAEDKTKAMDIDIVGFSRGAAQARDFANRLIGASTFVNGKYYYRYDGDDGKLTCQLINFRFMGLFDTVLSTNRSGYDYKLGIPSQFAYVAQAVALNEYRSGGISAFEDSVNIVSSWALRNSAVDPVDGKNYKQHMGGFPLVSIGASSSAPGATRIEMGFLGAHADIGGGYPDSESQLSQVALNWMVKQAQTAGVNMDVTKLSALPTGSAVLHDQSNAIRVGDPIVNTRVPTIVPLVSLATEDRAVLNAPSGTTQRTMGFGSGSKSMTNVDTTEFITYASRDPKNWGDDGPKSLKNISGNVDLQEYIKWLQADQRYQFVSQSK